MTETLKERVNPSKQDQSEIKLIFFWKNRKNIFLLSQRVWKAWKWSGCKIKTKKLPRFSLTEMLCVCVCGSVCTPTYIYTHLTCCFIWNRSPKEKVINWWSPKSHSYGILSFFLLASVSWYLHPFPLGFRYRHQQPAETSTSFQQIITDKQINMNNLSVFL